MKKKLNFGCGKIIKSKEKGWVNVDIQKNDNVDVSFNFNNFPYPFKDNTFDYILVDNVLEHLEEPRLVIEELRRICKNESIIEVIVPHCNSRWAWGDYTHKHYFNKMSLKKIFYGLDYQYKKDKLFKIKIKTIPQRPLKFFPEQILNFLSIYLNNIFVSINVKAKVIDK